MTGITESKTSFDTGMALIGLAVFIRCHTNDFFTKGLNFKCTTHTAIGTGSYRALFRQANFDNRFLFQCGSGTTIDTGTTGNTFGFHKGFHLPGRYF